MRKMNPWKKFWLRWAIKLIYKNFDVCEIVTLHGGLRGIFISTDLLENVCGGRKNLRA